MAHLDAAQAHTATCRPPRARLSRWQVAWLGLALAALASFFPLRFTATAGLRFDVGAQPAASAVRGVAQVLSSREMAYDAVRTLDAAEAARIAAGGLGTFGLGGAGPGEADGRSLTVRAAWRLMEDLEVEPVNGGRSLRLTLSAPTPALAARAADAYVTAFLALDAETRAAQGLGEAAQMPVLRRGEAGTASFLPDPPRPMALGLLAMAGLVLILARRRWSAPAAQTGPVDGAILPVQLHGAHRITWLGDGPGGGLDLDAAVDRLAAHVGPPGGMSHLPGGMSHLPGGMSHLPGGACHLILLTTEDLPEASAACAIGLARRLSEDAGVALVALDGTAETLAALVADPWAPGMSELLFGVAGFGETIHRDAKSRAHVIPPGRDARGGASVVAAERLALVLEALRRTYDYVVVAAPNLGAARGGQRLSALDPLVVCLHADSAPPTAAVEGFDALAAKRFARVVMLCVATGGAAEEDDGSMEPTPVPTFAAAENGSVALPPAAPERLAGAA